MSSKIGPHSLRPTADALRLARYATVAKLVNDFGPAAEMQRPGLTIIGRQISMYPEDPGRVITAENLRHLDPVLAARKFVGFQQRTYELNPLIRYWEGPNEPSWEVQNADGSVNIPATVANYEWYGAFEEERVRLLASVNLGAVICNFSVGTPDIGEDRRYAWLPMLPALRAAYFHGGLLGLHEYGRKSLKDQYEADKGEGWLPFRYRKVHRLILAPNGIGGLPIVNTEFGLDFRNLPDLDYVAELKWAEGEMRKDPYFLGATIFTFGASDTWEDFNLENTPQANALIEWAATTPPIETPPDEDDETGDDVTTNLLHNPDLFSGGMYTLPGRDNMRVPNEYLFEFTEGELIDTSPTGKPTLPPEMTTRSADGRSGTEMLPPEEHALYLAPDVETVYHVFKGWGVQHWTLSQQNLMLNAGRYLLSAQLYPDIYFARDGGLREWAPDPLSGEWRLLGGPLGDWLNGATTLPLGVPPRHQFGRWVQLTKEFDHPGGPLSVGLEFRARFGVDVVGAFVRRFSLIQVNVAGETPDSTVGIVSKLDSIIASAQEAKSQLQQAIRLLS